MRCQCLERGCIHVVFLRVGRRKTVLVISNSCSAHFFKRRSPLLLHFPTPSDPITPSQVWWSVPTLALKSPRRMFFCPGCCRNYRILIIIELVFNLIWVGHCGCRGTIVACLLPDKGKKVREKSRECHNHKPQPFPDPERKRKPTNPNKHKPNKRTKSTMISSLFPKRGNRNTKRTEKHKNKTTYGKTYNKSPRRINHKATKSKTNTGTTALERSVEQTTGGFKALLQLANFTLGPDATLNTEIHKNSVRIKAPNSVNASKRKHKNQINQYNKQRRVLKANSTVCQSK